MSSENKQNIQIEEPNFIPVARVRPILAVEIDAPQWMKDEAPNHAHGDGTFTCTICNGRLEPEQIVVEELKKKPTATVFRCHGECNRVLHVCDLEAGRANEKYNPSAVRRLAAKYLDAVVVSDRSADRKARQKELVLAALKYAAKGWHVFPVYEVEKNGNCACKGKAKEKCKPGKHPSTRHGLLDATTDRATILAWWGGEMSNRNIGVATGRISGFFGVDIDGEKGKDLWNSLIEQNGTIPDTVEQLTPRGGFHILFKTQPDIPIPTNAGVFGDGIDIRGDGGFLNFEPSNHVAGRQYVFELSSHPDEVQLASPPQWLLERIQTTSRQGRVDRSCSASPGESTRSFAEVLAGMPEGQRDDEIYRYACSRLSRGLSIAEIRKLVMEAAANCAPPFPEDEAEQKIESACKTHQRNHPNWTDPDYLSGENAVGKMVLEPSKAAKKGAELRDAIAKDRGAALEEGNLALMQSLQDDHLSEWARTKELLGRHHLVRDVERALKKRKLRVAKNEPPPRTYADECSKIGISPPEGSDNLQIWGTCSFTQDRKIVRLGLDAQGNLEASPVCDGIILPIKRIENAAQEDGIHYEVAFLKNDKWHSEIVPKKMLVDSNQITNLAQFDFPVSPREIKTTAELLAKTITLNTHLIPTVKALRRNGWTETNDAFKLDNEILTDKSIKSTYRPIIESKTNLFHKRGSLDEWKRIFGLSSNHPVPMFLTYGSFGGPLLKLFYMNSIGMDLAVRTTSAKTLSFGLAASVWGKPTTHSDENTAGFMVPLDSTEVGFEHLCYQRNHTLLLCDDSTKNDEKRAGLMHSLVYMGINSAGRTRGKRQGGLRETLSWQTVIYFNGEKPSNTTDGGGRVRFIPITEPPYGHKKTPETKMITDALKYDLINHYGHAGPLFIQWLMENKSLWPQFYSEFQARSKELAGNSHETTVDRMAQACALISIAGKLAHQALDLPWTFDDPVDHLWPGILKKCSNIHTHTRAFAEIADWLNQNREKFINPLDSETVQKRVIESYGIWNHTASDWEYVAINPTVLSDELKRRNYTAPDSIFTEWLREGWIKGERESGEPKFTRRISLRNLRSRYICILSNALDKETPQTDEDPETAKARLTIQNLVDCLWDCAPLFRKRDESKKLSDTLRRIKPEDYDKTLHPYPDEWDDIHEDADDTSGSHDASGHDGPF